MLRQICTALLTCTTIAQAVITRVEILHHKERDQVVYLYSSGYTHANIAVEQRRLLVQQAKELKSSTNTLKQNLCVFVEDMLTPCRPLKQLERFARQARITYIWRVGTFHKEFLAGLVEELRNNSVPTINVEFRQRMGASLLGKADITANEALDDLYQAIRELNEDAVSEPYKTIIQQELVTINQRLQAARPFIKLLRSDTQSLRAMLEKAPNDHPAVHHTLTLCGVNFESYLPEQKKQDLIEFHLNFPILALHIFAGIGQRPDTKHIMACAGEIHITRLRSLLEQAGFTTIKACHGTEELEDIIWPDKAVDLRNAIAS